MFILLACTVGVNKMLTFHFCKTIVLRSVRFNDKELAHPFDLHRSERLIKLIIINYSRDVTQQISSVKMVFSTYSKQRILYLHNKGFRAPSIKKMLEEEGLYVSRIGIHTFLLKFKETDCITRRLGSGRPSKITTEVKKIVEMTMRLELGNIEILKMI